MNQDLHDKVALSIQNCIIDYALIANLHPEKADSITEECKYKLYEIINNVLLCKQKV